MKLDPKKVLVISAVLIAILALSIVFYYNYRLDEQSRVFTSRISSMENELSGSIDQLSNQMSLLQKNLTSEIGVVDDNLKSFKSQNSKEIDTLGKLIDEIEKQSNIKLDKLQDDLTNIRVKGNDFTAIINDVIQSVVSVGTNRGQGSGAVIDDSGFIVTNYHVVQGASFIRILTYDNSVYDAELIGFNDLVDVAVIKADVEIDSLEFADSDDVEIGEKVIALGNPAGLSFTVTEGIVSAVHRTGPNNLDIYLQTDVPINPGNSGGPLVNINSRIVGLNNFKLSGGFEGLGFAIESNTVEEVAEQIITDYLSTLE